MKKVLVADDDPSILEVISLILEDAGFKAETSVDGEAIYKMEKEYPDLLLLDIWMSGMDGREICRYLKSQELTRNIPIIMISANKDVAEIARDCGADDFVAKPFDMEYLLATIRKYVA